MNKSESIANLAVALIKFNGKVSAISKDKKNPQFKSEYVTLDKLIEITRPILQTNGLSVMQFPLTKDSGEIGVQTILLHESGEFIEGNPIFMTPQRMVKGGQYEVAQDPQAAGSLISYLRRYSYQAILNLNTGEDDDGNDASNAGGNAFIDKVAVKTIEGMIKDLKINRMEFLSYAHAMSVEQITVKNLPVIMDALNKKKVEVYGKNSDQPITGGSIND
ncbi:ERF superfamily protein [Clostridium puniceum]|uniref:ERF superfamily protein n=1 Tax=Clostridium puniceum TaxID=29367 RepID=A0A1S8TBY5_9CLOT|nr:ERF family protein [Clostridium puniceum]OOM75124.1 ERF superfamily protein [Clostridium puniceum]